ncbi:MAG: serine hydrolase domain-containing protein [Gordonia sp. (in: high G+C Gram-positive bacteria)]|uniref:serine hydrolase domain-containing protein n=1 Tax=Gordonia sp. (in: high G+C Gram-positive bacteria) TaxID=84139 RepID=UPI003C77DDE1
MSVNGTIEPRFARLREAFEEELSTGNELGGAIAVNVDGDLVVDLWGGYRDATKRLPWERDTIVNVWSTTKEVTALAVLLLVDRGLIDLDAPVAHYWPEFAENGKDAVLVRHLMSHTSGVSGWDRPWEVEDMYDWDKSIAQLARQAPCWEPGTASGYHANNQGHLLGEVVRRVSGMPLKVFVAAEIAGPLGIDLQIGATEADDHRIAEIVFKPTRPIDPDKVDMTSITMRTFTGPIADAGSANTEAWRRADMGALNGHTTARALARALSVISRGSVDGVSLSPNTIDRIFEEQASGVDLVLGAPLRWGIGYGLPEPATIPYLPTDERVCFWGGWGGSLTAMFPDRGVTISYVMNRMGRGVIGSDRSERYYRAILEGLESLNR